MPPLLKVRVSLIPDQPLTLVGQGHLQRARRDLVTLITIGVAAQVVRRATILVQLVTTQLAQVLMPTLKPVDRVARLV